MSDGWEFVRFLVGVLSAIAIVIFVVGFCIYSYTVNVGEANVVAVYRGNEVTPLYHGKKAFVKIDSGGMTTTITVYRKLFPFPAVDKVYSDKEIRVE